jgi:NADH:ubiquinone oxidoreductase subunit C
MNRKDVITTETNFLLQALSRELPTLIYSVAVTTQGITLTTGVDQLRPLVIYLRDSSYLQFKTLVDIAVVDHLEKGGSCRFALTYHLLSSRYNRRISIQLFCSETTLLPSLTTP